MATRDLDSLLPQTAPAPSAAPSRPVPEAAAPGAVRKHGKESGGWVLWASMAFVAGGAALWYYSASKRAGGHQQFEMQPRRQKFQAAPVQVQDDAAAPKEREALEVQAPAPGGATAWSELVAQAQGRLSQPEEMHDE